MTEMVELARYHEGGPLECIFADPDFMSDPSRVDRLCDLMKGRALDISFCAMVRADAMAKHPDVVAKMCDVGINRFEMGIESPNSIDLRSTKKGMTTRVHIQAVRNIRKSGGIPGGTFVIGLPDQTAEEIRGFPDYAREIGLLASAFGIATPFPGTEFYEEVNEKGLIFEKDWDKFDEMHSVYKTKYLSKDEVEELATYCMARFWNLDNLVEQANVFRVRNGNGRLPLMSFALDLMHNINFLTRAGTELQGANIKRHARTFLEALPNPTVETYTRDVGIHNVIDLSRFLHILGPQKTQITLSLDTQLNTSFILKTTGDEVEYVKVIRGREDDSTIDIALHLGKLGKESLQKRNIAKSLLLLYSQQKNSKGRWGLSKLMFAVAIEVLTWKLMNQRKSDRVSIFP
jgi:hypothetical protein